jgi:hypothetical protein
MDETLVSRSQDRFATNLLGGYAIGKVLLRAIEKGVYVHQPLIECRYDLVLDDGLKLYRTQVKYAGGSSPKHCQGMVPIGLRKWRNDGRAIIPCYTAAEIDLLLVYVRRIDRVLWFGPEVFDGRKRLHIRTEPTRNNQVKGCLMAADYIW